MRPGDTLRAGQKLKLTSTTTASLDDEPRLSRTKRTTSSKQAGAGPVTYIVRAGDTLYAIAKLFQCTVAQITAWNDLNHAHIKPGQKLTIRVSSRGG